MQARTQLEAICAVRPIEEVKIYAPTRTHVDAFIEANQQRVQAKLIEAASPQEAVANADIICAATTSHTPVFNDSDLPKEKGIHINGVGSYTLDMIEIDPQTLERAEIFVDSKDAAMEEAGEIVAAINQKRIFPAELTEIGEVVAGAAPGRESTGAAYVFQICGRGGARCGRCSTGAHQCTKDGTRAGS